MSAPSTSAPKPVWSALLLGLVVLVIFLGITAVFRAASGSGTREEQDRAEVRMKNLAELQEQNATALNEYSWINKEQGKIRIPIRQAMEIEIVALNQTKPAPAYPIATPAVVAPADTAPAASAEATPEPAAPATPAVEPAAAQSDSAVPAEAAPAEPAASPQ